MSGKALEYDLIVIGCGISGYHTALTARRYAADMRIAVISAEKIPTYSAPSLPDVISGHIPPSQAMIASEETFAREGIDLFLDTRVCSADPACKSLETQDGRRFSYGSLVLATGSVPVVLRKMPGITLEGNHVLKTLQDAVTLADCPARRAVVVGSGAIGLECASALRERGVAHVTLVEALEWLNPKCFDKAASDYMKAHLEQVGVEVITGQAIRAVHGTDRVEGVLVGEREIPCDLVVWGVGMRPVTELAAALGAALGSGGGVRIDRRMRTSVPDVYAVGDCTEPYDLFWKRDMPNMLWRTATEQGVFLGKILAGCAPDEEYEGAKLLFLTYVGEAAACAYGYTEADLAGKRYRVLEDRQANTYRKVLLYRNRIAGFQMVNTLEGSSELYAQMLKNTPVEWPEGRSREADGCLREQILWNYLDRMPAGKKAGAKA